MSRRLIGPLSLLVAAGLTLTGCGGGAKKMLGLEKQAPDEFTVVSRAPLTVPPDFKLRPPEPGATRPQEGTTSDQARAALTGTRGQLYARAGLSQGEQLLLKQAGAENANPDIRTVVNKESSVLAEEEKSFTDTLVFWRDPEPSGTVVNAAEEAKRLRQNQALGKSVSTGDTPQIERRQRGILEGIF